MAKKQDPRVDKRRVTMTSWIAVPDGKGGAVTHKHEAVDYVPASILEGYVEDAKTRWQQVDVSDEPDAGPAGYDGDTVIPNHLKGV